MTLRFHKLFLLAAFLVLPMLALAQVKTVGDGIAWLKTHRQATFVYDSALKTDMPYHGPNLSKGTLRQALDALFSGTGISYKMKRGYILLKADKPADTQRPAPAPPQNKPERTKRHTLSGYVRDAGGETLINATVYDLTTKQGTMTNAYGFYSLTLPDGDHHVRFSYLGYGDQTRDIKLTGDRTLSVSLQETATLGEVTVTGDLNSPLLSTQTGKRSLSRGDIQTEFSLLSSPDLVKTLQRISGVAEGVELASGLYVHGGNNDENLYLIDGTPLYSINHTLGLFSAFNTDVVKNVDFYKSGFPARYGGRLSSVVDVRTADGDFQHLHGSYRIGLIDGSVHLEGPLRKGKTSFNIGLRRSWLDLITRPAFAIYNHSNPKDEDDITLNYFFHDLNARVTNIFSPRSRLSLSVYSGEDALYAKTTWLDDYTSGRDYEVSKNRYSWGNINTALDWQLQLSPKLFANFTGVYTHNRSHLHDSEDDRVYEDAKEVQMSRYSHMYRSTVDDVGYRAAFDYRPSPHHHLRFGTDYTWHNFRPQTRDDRTYSGDSERPDTTAMTSRNHLSANEWNLYAEDEVTLSDHWSLNAGLNASLFHVQGKNFTAVDPRLAVKWQLSEMMSMKLSWTAMTQYVHKISNSVLDLPTDYWVPTTARLQPMRSHQVTAGLYLQPDKHWLLSLEGYWKRSRHLLQYSSWTGLEPPAESWDVSVMDGRGRYYGIEVDATYKSRGLLLQGSYTLSWNRRNFPDFYQGWFYDKFDNRHKVNLSARWNITDHISTFAVWTLHSGNRLTIPTQYVKMPQGMDSENTEEFVYERPNNFTLPLYHRLDVGFDFRHTTKHGHERVWNVSFYNAYCHLNSLWVDFKFDHDGRFVIKNRAFIPIVPSCSYTIKF